MKNKSGWWISVYNADGTRGGQHGHFDKLSTCKKILNDWPKKKDSIYVISDKLFPYDTFKSNKKINIIYTKQQKNNYSNISLFYKFSALVLFLCGVALAITLLCTKGV